MSAGGLRDVGSVLANLGGHFVDTLGVVSAIDRGNLGNYLMNQRLASQDPTLRASMQTSPFFAGEMGQYLTRAPQGQVGPGVAGPQPVGAIEGAQPGQLVAQLPPLSAEAQALQAKQQYQANLLQRANQGDPYAMVAAGMPISPQLANQMAAQAGVGTAGGPTKFAIKEAGGTATYGGPAQLVHAGGDVYERQPDGTLKPIISATTESKEPPEWLKPLLTGQPTGAPTSPMTVDQLPTEAPAVPPGGGIVKSNESIAAWEARHPRMDQAAGEAPTPMPQLPSGHMPLTDMPTLSAGELLKQKERTGYPPPVPPEEVSAPTARPIPSPAAAIQPPAAGPARPQLPPGVTVRWNPKTGTTFSVSGPRQATPRIPATSVREMSNMATAAQAARAAIALLDAGPQSPLTVAGVPIYRPGRLAGPVTGRALGALATVSDQPLAIEETQLRALLDHAKTGVTSIFGQRVTKENKEFIDALLPDATQPPGILRSHLERLANFYESQVALRETLSSLSDEQKQAFLLQQFKSTMLGLQPSTPPAPTTTPTLPTMDLR